MTLNVFSTWAAAVVCILLILLGIHLQSQVFINHDIGWIAHSAAWLLDGRRFGTDILDPNPPLAWFLMLPAAAAVRAGLLPEIIAIQVWNWLMTVAGLALVAATLAPMARFLDRFQVVGLLVSSVAVAAILPVGNFGQRDVLALILILPYVISMIGRMQGAPAIGRIVPILIGFAAGVGCCLKPFLLAVPVLLELLQLALGRSFRAMLRAETVAMAAAVLSYPAAILLFARDYLDFALPLIRAVYWAYDDTGNRIGDRFTDAALPAAYGLGIALVTLSFNRTHAVLLTAIAGFSISYWVQGKGFPYHAYPILGASCVFLTYSIIGGIAAIRRSTFIKTNVLRWAVVAVLLFVALPVLREPFLQAHYWYQVADRTQGVWGRPRQAVIDRLRELGAHPTDYLFAISTHPYPGFPTVNYLGARWAGREVAQFAIPAHVRRKEFKDQTRLREIDQATDMQVEIVIADLARHRPAYVMVNAKPWRLGLEFRKFDDLAFYSRNPEFASLWACYEEIEEVGQIRLFRRRAGCPVAPAEPVAPPGYLPAGKTTNRQSK